MFKTSERHAVVVPISHVLTDSNFSKQKLSQLSSAKGPTLLEFAPNWLTPELVDLVTMPEATKLAAAVGPDAWARLPANCLGLTHSFAADSALNVFRGGAPTTFVARATSRDSGVI